MRLFVVLLILTGVFFWLGTTVQNSLEASASDLAAQARALEEALAAENWTAADRAAARLNTLWQDTQKGWDLFIHHREMDNIEESLARVTELVQARQADLARTELAAMKLLIAHLPDKEKFSFANIL